MRTRIPHSLLMLLLVWAMLILVGCYTGRDFVKGADVGSLSQQERKGIVFHDHQGRERDCLDMIVETGL